MEPRDAAVAFDHLNLAATERGLGICWIGDFNPDAARAVLGLSDGVEPLAFMPLGFPAEEPGFKRRKELDEIVRYSGWQPRRRSPIILSRNANGETAMSDLPDLVFKPVTPATWADFEALFGENGAMAGCWCMWWRVKRKDWEANAYAGNKAAMKALVNGGTVPGLLAYDGSQAVGWVSVAPREDFDVLQRSPVLKPVDDQPVWSIVCFYVDKQYRDRGLTLALIDAAVDYACRQGATLIEGYPLDPQGGDTSNVSAFTGFLSTFDEAGFTEVARRSGRKPIVRKSI